MQGRGSRRVDQQTLNDMINDNTPQIPSQLVKPRDTIDKLQQAIGFGKEGCTAFADLAKLRLLSP